MTSETTTVFLADDAADMRMLVTAVLERAGFTVIDFDAAIREWARQFYPDGRGGSAADLQAASTNQKG